MSSSAEKLEPRHRKNTPSKVADRPATAASPNPTSGQKGLAAMKRNEKGKAGDSKKRSVAKVVKKLPVAKVAKQLADTKGAKQLPVAKDETFPIIGMGASAGGLEAFEQFFRYAQSNSGMAFVLVSHLDPSHASLLTEILQRIVSMPVQEATDQMAVLPNRVYVIPPNRDMTIFHGALQLSMPEKPRGQRMPIDFFLRSLAEDQQERAIGVILSGTGTDGTLGLRAILGAGGASFVQDPPTAKYDGMPSYAIQSGLATYVLPVEKMPEQLAAYAKKTFAKKIRPALPQPAVPGSLNQVLMLLRSRTGHDFSLYKKTTIRRRIERRMIAHGIADTPQYVQFLREHPEEVQLLFQELLINVTSFFRDPEAFATLKKDVLPLLFMRRPENTVFRIWVPGCATGEEAYSIAILFREQMDEIKQDFKVQIYSTDIDDDSIGFARSGFYPANIAIDVSPERLRRFFTKEEAGYRVKKEIRDMVVFAIQNAIKDPPFTRLDLLSCRNLLIYLEPELQNRLMPVLHYALNAGGFLFLGPSEGVGTFVDLFAPLDKKWRIFQAKASAPYARTMFGGDLSWTGDQARRAVEGEAVKKPKETNFAELTRKVLLQSYAPPSVVTDEKGHILFVHGETGKYLRPAPGQASLNVIEMAREELQLELRMAINNAVATKQPIICKDLAMKTNGRTQAVTVTVRPLAETETAQRLLIISFLEVEHPKRKEPSRAKPAAVAESAKRTEELEQELRYTKENLLAAIEELQASNEELTSTNEELQSTNEELQSTNEELQTSKEEIQSMNEELVTVNSERQAKIEQLAETQNDMRNLLESTNIGTVFLDENMIIKNYTHEATKLFRLVASDSGRPLGDITSNIKGESLLADARAVLDSLVPREKLVQTADGSGYLLRILPYRTLENVIEGVVLTFTDTSKLQRSEEEARAAREYAESIVDTVREPLIILDADLRVVSASRSFYRIFRVLPEETAGRLIYDLGNRQWDIPKLRELLEKVLPEKTVFENMKIEHDFPGIGHKRMALNARQVAGTSEQAKLILLAMEDIT